MSRFTRFKRRCWQRCKDVWKIIRKPVIGAFGAIVLLLGIIMIVTPGPALVMIPLGVGILSSQFPIVRRWVKPIRDRVQPWYVWAKSKWRAFRGRFAKSEKAS